MRLVYLGAPGAVLTPLRGSLGASNPSVHITEANGTWGFQSEQGFKEGQMPGIPCRDKNCSCLVRLDSESSFVWAVLGSWGWSPPWGGGSPSLSREPPKPQAVPLRPSHFRPSALFARWLRKATLCAPVWQPPQACGRPGEVFLDGGCSEKQRAACASGGPGSAPLSVNLLRRAPPPSRPNPPPAASRAPRAAAWQRQTGVVSVGPGNVYLGRNSSAFTCFLFRVRDKNFFNIKAKKKKGYQGGLGGVPQGRQQNQQLDYLSSYFGKKAPSSARHVSNLSFRMSATIIPFFVTSFDQRMKNCHFTQTKLFLGFRGGGPTQRSWPKWEASPLQVKSGLREYWSVR